MVLEMLSRNPSDGLSFRERLGICRSADFGFVVAGGLVALLTCDWGNPGCSGCQLLYPESGLQPWITALTAAQASD